ncbi:type II toxin-antitoxin system VapB family antitoxin [Micromonospora vinacea]|uniref:type II toxin-antitoxin system VapB family antitoxin n=1 Tax=Micromonospora vinacea TaxID=709878 RepID=UPI003451D15C
MSRTILDVDDELLAEAGTILGTTTKKATVNAALKAVVDREKRRQFADFLHYDATSTSSPRSPASPPPA